MRAKTLIAAAVAGTLSLPIASYANDLSAGVEDQSAVSSLGGSVQTQAGDLHVLQGQPADPMRNAGIDSQPEAVTWFYPDGSVVHQEGTAYIYEFPDEGSASSGGSSDSQFRSSSLNGSANLASSESLGGESMSESTPGEPEWIIAEWVEPGYLILVE